MSRTILITGASSGFGLMLANSFHQKGFTVIGTTRDPEKHKERPIILLLKRHIN